MDEVSVANIPDRSGQVLRQSLADQMQTAGAPTQEIFLLSVSYNIAVQGVGLQQDTSSTRNRFIATANWTLAPIGSPHLPLTQGQASTEDALNIIDQQYFASALETNTIDRQLADEIATQISAQVAAYFKTHPTAG
jgi:LPS-assembly lipoprotein